MISPTAIDQENGSLVCLNIAWGQMKTMSLLTKIYMNLRELDYENVVKITVWKADNEKTWYTNKIKRKPKKKVTWRGFPSTFQVLKVKKIEERERIVSNDGNCSVSHILWLWIQSPRHADQQSKSKTSPLSFYSLPLHRESVQEDEKYTNLCKASSIFILKNRKPVLNCIQNLTLFLE